MNSFKNLIWGVLNSFVVIIAGIIVPRFIIQYLGSQSNGFLATLSQLYSYLQLLDAGVAVASVQALYAPLTKNNFTIINEILSTTRRYYQKISIFYIVIVVLLAGILPFLLKTPFNYPTVFFSFFFMGVGHALWFAIQGKFIAYLIAIGKQYYVYIASTIYLVLTNLGKVWLAYHGFNIIYIFLLQMLVQILISLLYILLQKYRYGYLNFYQKSKVNFVKQNHYSLIEQIAFIVFMNTDIVLISIFMNMYVVSKYSLYALVVSTVYSFVGLTWSAVHAFLAKIYVENLQLFNRLEQILERAFIILSFWAYTMVMLLLNHFIRLYTNTIADYNYLDPKLAFWLTVSYLLFCIRNPFISLSLDTGYIKESSQLAVMEVLLNIILSLILFKFFSYYGLVYATIIGTCCRLIMQVILVKKTIQKESILPFVKNNCFCLAIFCLCIVGGSFWSITVSDWLSFFVSAVLLSMLAFLLYGGYFLLFGRKDFFYLLAYLKSIYYVKNT